MLAAMGLSLFFTLTYATLAAKKKPAGGPGADAFAGRAAIRAGAGPGLEHMLAAFMDDDQADATLRTITNWARYAELFTFDSKTGLFSLENE